MRMVCLVLRDPEYKYCKILKAASKLRLDALMIQEAYVNGLVDLQVIERGGTVTRFSGYMPRHMRKGDS